MLSKAFTSVCSSSLKSTNKAAISRLLLPNTQLFSATSHITPRFNYIPRFSFSEINEKTKSKKSVEKAKPRQNTEEKQEENEDDGQSDFVNYMQDQQAESKINYEFNSKSIFEVASNPDEFTKRYLFYWGMGAVWFGVTYITFNFLNPWLAVIPCWFLAGSLVTIRMSSRFAKNMVKKIELVDHEKINIFPLAMKGKSVPCNIKDTEILGIKMLTESPQTKEGVPVKSYLVMANFVEATKNKSYPKMRLILDTKLTTVPNIDLLKAILHGNTSEVAKFRYVEKSQEEKDLEQEKLSRNKMVDAEGEAKFDFNEEEFEQFKRDLQREAKQEDLDKESEVKK